MLNFTAAIKNFVATVVRRAAPRKSCVNALFPILAACLLFHAMEVRAAEASYVGSTACASCHVAQSKAWRSSHHAAAMAVATPETVLGDFKDVSIESHGSKGRFLRDGDRFIVETEGRDGKTARFEVAWTFGVEPLQQYLVAFPDGRVQALPWAWDSRTIFTPKRRVTPIGSDEHLP